MESFKVLIVILVSSVLVDNYVLSRFLGICPFLGVSKKLETAAGMGATVIFVITLASAVTGVIYKFVLEKFNITLVKIDNIEENTKFEILCVQKLAYFSIILSKTITLAIVKCFMVLLTDTLEWKACNTLTEVLSVDYIEGTSSLLLVAAQQLQAKY